MEYDFANSVVCILVEGRLDDVGDRTAGTGFLVSDDGLIATCAHVIEGSRAEEFVHLIFSNLEKREIRVARRLPEYWKDKEEEDVAILQLEESLPTGVVPLPLATYPVSKEETFESFGFPANKSEDGLRAVCRYLGSSVKEVTLEKEADPKHISLLQLSSSQISLGFSGAPIVDQRRGTVIGMVTEIIGMETVILGGREIRFPSDPGGKQLETAFATPAKTLLAVCLRLQPPDRCPYRGLDVFTEEDAGIFFGRQSIIDSAINRLRSDDRFLAVLGPSGSGKSSLVQAGLIPKLREGALRDSEHWGIILARPGDNPFQQLATQGLNTLSQDLSVSTKEWLHQHPQQTHLVLVIDQFEELLTICPERLCHDFIKQAMTLLNTPSHVSIIIVMRNDFYPQLVQHNELEEWLERNQRLLNIPQNLDRQDVIAIVQKPASLVGLRFEEGLAEEIVSNVVDIDTSRNITDDAPSLPDEKRYARSTMLPLLEFALTQLWQKRKHGQLMLADYKAIGGVTGSLNRWANDALNSFTPEQKNKAKRIFTDLAYFADQQQIVSVSRRQRPLQLLYRNTQEQEEINQIIKTLVNRHLLITSEDQQSHQTIVEIIHDALLWEWEDLSEWLKKNHPYLIWRQEFERRVNEWVETNAEHPDKRDEYKLIGGIDLQKAQQYQKEQAEDLDQTQQDFIQASQQRQYQQELLRKRYDRIKRRVMLGLIGTGVVVVTAGGVTADLLWQASQLHYKNVIVYPGHKTPVLAVIWQHDAKRIASADIDYLVHVWYPDSAQHIYTYSGHEGAVTSLAWSPDHLHIVSGSVDTTAHVWIADGQGADNPNPYIFRGHQQPIHAITWCPDPSQSLIASGGADMTVLVWSPEQKKLITTYRHHVGPVNALAWSSDGRYIASGSGSIEKLDNTVQVWEPHTKRQIQIYKGHVQNISAHVLSVTWSPDSKYIASGDWTGQVHVWSIKDGHRHTLYDRHHNPVMAVSWSTDGKYIASASKDSTVHVWEPFTGNRITTYKDHKKGLNSVAWSPTRGDKRIISAGDDWQVREWQLEV